MNMFSEGLEIPWLKKPTIVVTGKNNKKYTLKIDTNYSRIYGRLFYDIYVGRTIKDKSQQNAILYIYFDGGTQGFNFVKYDDEITNEAAVYIVKDVLTRFKIRDKVRHGTIHKQERDGMRALPLNDTTNEEPDKQTTIMGKQIDLEID